MATIHAARGATIIIANLNPTQILYAADRDTGKAVERWLRAYETPGARRAVGEADPFALTPDNYAVHGRGVAMWTDIECVRGVIVRAE